MMSVATRYAVKSLLRHSTRTLLSVLGVALGCALSLITISFVRGEGEMFMRSVAETGAGHVRIAPAGWNGLRENDMRVDRWEAELEDVRAMPEVRVAAPRARAFGLLAFGNNSVGAEVVGVDPGVERAANRLVAGKTEGRFLSPDDAGTPRIAVVIGKAAAQQLEVELDDDVMLTTSDAEGQMRQAMLRIVGLVSTGIDEIDRTICQVPLEDFSRLSGAGGAGEIVVLLRDHKRLEGLAARLRDRLTGDNEVLTWYQVSPELADAVKIDESFTWLTVIVVVVVVFLGIMSAQLTAVLDRRREFAVLAALGMKGTRLVHVMFLEGIVVGLAGAALGLVLALPVVKLMATYGIDLRGFTGEEGMVTSGVMIDPILYGDMGWWLVSYGLGLSLCATLLASIYPALYAARTDPASALRAV